MAKWTGKRRILSRISRRAARETTYRQAVQGKKLVPRLHRRTENARLFSHRIVRFRTTFGAGTFVPPIIGATSRGGCDAFPAFPKAPHWLRCARNASQRALHVRNDAIGVQTSGKIADRLRRHVNCEPALETNQAAPESSTKGATSCPR
jgi:hypothetical protein